MRSPLHLLYCCITYLIDDHKADLDNNDSHTRKPKKHFKRLMAMPMRLFSPIPNPTMDFNKWALLARDIRNHYLGKVTPCTMSSWPLRPQDSKAPASRRRCCQHIGGQAKVNDSPRN